MAPALAKLRFLALQLLCGAVDWVLGLPRLLWRRLRNQQVVRVTAPLELHSVFNLNAVHLMKYRDPAYTGHTATILCAFRPQQPVPYERETSAGGDGNPMCIDWFPCASGQTPEGNKGLIVVFPGLSSWSGSNYVERFVWHAHRQGYHCAVFNARGLGDTPLEQPRFMSAVWTEDVREVMTRGALRRQAIQRRFGGAMAVVGVGFSLGGVILSKFVGEESVGGKKPFDAVLVVNSPLDALASNDLMMKFFNRLAYQPSMVGGLVRAAKRHRAVLGRIPKLPEAVSREFSGGSVEQVFKQVRTIADFDRLITCPANGFQSPDEYYKAISPLRWIGSISVPTLCICAEDDPVCGTPPMTELDFLMSVNSKLGVVSVPCGGHLGYIMNTVDEWKQKPSFMEKLLCQLCDAFLASQHKA